jgi:two-component system LytT family sensor kinase
MSRFKLFLITIHIAGWLLFMAFPLLFLNRDGQTNAIHVLATPYYWVFCLTYIALFYINGYLLIPQFFLRKKYIGYAVMVFVLLSCVYVIRPYDKLLQANDTWRNHAIGGNMRFYGPPSHLGNRPPGSPQQDSMQHPPEWNNHHGPPHWNNGFPPGNMPPGFHGGPMNWRIDSTSLFIFLMIMAISTAIKTVQQWQLTEQRAARAEADKASAELSFLKAQINPHFLFNTLNNIYTLAVTKDEHAPDSIMKLSNIMRYVTDDVPVDLVPLQSEIDCISDYIELQRLRMNDDTQIDFTVKGDADNKTIPPLVLMTFIENVFKYGISNHEPSVITINIVVNDSITFFCQNRIFNTKKQTQRTGIGIKNTKQRLEHLYPGKHLLYITSDSEFYTVQLTLQS